MATVPVWPRLAVHAVRVVGQCGCFAIAMLMLGAEPCRADDLVGRTSTELVQPGDTLLDIARRHDLGFAEIMAANPDTDVWLPPEGSSVLVPGEHILPVAPRTGIVINLAELRLYYYPPDGGEPMSFPIGIGREGWQTPEGHTRILIKAYRPTWVPTASEHAENPDLPAAVPAGPDNPMGEYALYLGWRGYAIHGTNRPYSIGRRDSHGCIRLFPEDIARLYALADIGTGVMVVDQPYKAGWSDGELFLEIHPGQAGADALEAEQVPASVAAEAVDAWLAAFAGPEAARINWQTVHLAERQMRGVPVQVTSHR